MIRSFKYRLYPDKDQQTLLDKHFGATRLVYNLGLETKMMSYNGSKSTLTFFDLSKQLVDLKKEYKWLNEVSAQSLQSSLRNLDDAYEKFFKGTTGFPTFKSKSAKQAYQCPQDVRFKDGKLSIPKFRSGINIELHRPFKGTIKRATISKTPTGKYFASLTCDSHEAVPEKQNINKAVGIDLGIKTFATLSDGTKFENPKHLNKSIDKLKWLQRQMSKKKKGSSRYKRFKLRVAKAHEKVANQRKDFLHKLSDAITKRFDTLCIEKLEVSDMLKNHMLARSIEDCGWGIFGSFLKYKSEQRGVNLFQIGRFEPSSKTCPTCSTVNNTLALSDREWTCFSCNTLHDRDVAAAVNILNFGLRDSGTERAGEDVELPICGWGVETSSILKHINI